MNVRCPECDTVYRVDPDLLPDDGVRAGCDFCGARFHVGPTEAIPAIEEPPAPAPAAPEREEAVPQPARAPVFGPQDPATRARRLARALVSDIVVYNPERREKSLEAGTLRTDFREEILKSWDEYVEQVGEQLAKQSPYFRDALNEILAKGQAVF